ncbi:protein kinase [Kitasatospora sp. NPDC096147]|uniref:serine/threonine protein kinase n=1 Tax=Kitasatospora sp. NPDC096147 TaxID=3364093 RepID=UPI003816C849
MWGRGTVLGERYTLTERVGGGGMGDVWRATDGVLEREVAVKIMHPGLLEDRNFTERFRREARILATLKHPGIVHVHDYGEPGEGEDERIAYIVMEFIDGKPLNDVLTAEGPMVPARALGIMADALDALHAAHQREIVHRDIKPSNLMLRTDSGVTVTDFGIAHAMAGTKITTTNSVLGTALYIAPEQADGGSTSPASDLYSLGVVAFELLTGQLPFTGETVLEIVLKHLQQPAPQLGESFPEPVREFVAKALRKDPAERFPDAAAMAAAARAAAGRPEAAEPVREPTVIASAFVPVRPGQAETPVTVSDRSPQERRRRRTKVLVPIVVPVLITAGAGGVYLLEQTPWRAEAGGAKPSTAATAPQVPAAATGTDTGSPSPSGTGDPNASATPAASPVPSGTETTPGQPTPDQPPAQGGSVAGGASGGGAASGSGGAASGGAASGGAAGGKVSAGASGGGGVASGGSGGGAAASGGSGSGGAASGGAASGGSNSGGTTTQPPAQTAQPPAPKPTPPAPVGDTPPSGCGGTGWGSIVNGASGRKLGLSTSGPDGGAQVLSGGSTGNGWVRSSADSGGWYEIHPCSLSKPAMVQDFNPGGTYTVSLSTGFSFTYRWAIVSAGSGRYTLRDHGSSTCLTDNGAGVQTSMQSCTPGNRSQEWSLPW